MKPTSTWLKYYCNKSYSIHVLQTLRSLLSSICTTFKQDLQTKSQQVAIAILVFQNTNSPTEILKQNFHSQLCYTAEVTTSHSSTTLGTPSTGLPLYTLIIIVAVILGFLLLFVACAVLSLTCAIICKRKKRASLPLRIHSLHPNMYETSSSSVSEVKASFGKQDSYSLSTEKPKLPADPEYATLSEWQREMTESPNPFYDSSTSVEMKSRAVEVPQLEWSGSAWDTNIPIASMNQNCSELSRQQSLGQSGHHMTTKSHSMHDMRNSIAINNKSSFQRDGSVTPGPSCSGMMRSYGCHQPMSSSPPPLPLSPPPPLPLSSPTPASPPPPPPPKRKGSVRYPASSAPHVSGGVGAHNLSGSSGNAVSPLVQHNMRAKKHRQSHEVFNSEYEVINGIRNKSNRAMNDY